MKRKTMLILLCILFAGMTAYFGLGLYKQLHEYRAGEKAYDALTQYIHPQTPPVQTAPLQEDAVDTKAPDDVHLPFVDFDALQSINTDVTGWIYIEGTNINYPVVQGPDNSYYLRRLFDKSSNRAGSIFMDFRNERDMSHRNTVLYGHHMKNGTMFNQITKYKDQTFYEEHPTGLFITPNKNYIIEFVAGYVTNMNSDAWKIEFKSDEEFSLWLENAISLSTFTSTVKPTPQNRVVTLSTCTYEYNDARYVLIGILKESQRTKGGNE